MCLIVATIGGTAQDVPEVGQGEPQEEDELEGEVEREPVDNVHQVLKDRQEGKDNPVLRHTIVRAKLSSGQKQPQHNKTSTYGEPLGVVRLGSRKESVERVVAREDKAGHVGQQLAAEVEDDGQEVQHGEAADDVRLGHVGRLLEVVEHGVLGQLAQVISIGAMGREESQRAALGFQVCGTR